MDTEGLLKSFKEHKVDFVVIGATAFPPHGYARASLDIDLFIRPTRANAARAWKALSAFGYDVSDIPAESLLQRKLLIRQYAVAADLHPFVAGVSFGRVWKNKIQASFGRVKVFFPSLSDLIAMKRAANRPKDREDLKYLLRLKKRA
ncbi:MAG: hypothetical protein HYZ94_01120 [Candidatus Omnitrophica bacterium]|nr:hypothetical protein [Candidatus Omnitrophota bacterium]